MLVMASLLTSFLVSTVDATFAYRGLADMPTRGTQVASAEDRAVWWNGLTTEKQTKLKAIYDSSWFASVDSDTQIAYTHLANSLYDFINSGADAHFDDSYTSFAPILLRAAFHSSGSYFLPNGSGGSNGGTIFHHGELEDDQNGCIDTATMQLEELFRDHDAVPLSDAIIVAGTVALDVMEFPKMELVRVAGGRDMIDGTAFRDRLPSADDDPLELFTKHYGLTSSELVAFIGGAHNFGSAHGKCTGYVGQWTATPLSWFGVGGSEPTFFGDLLRDDWRWYEVCTYYNDTVVYKSIEDPFASGAMEEEEEEHGDGIPLGCPIMQSREPLICEEQAMRGCNFEDGQYGLGESPCDINLLQMRLKSDFFLKANPSLLPHSKAFAEDADKLAVDFGNAYRKVTHLGLDRCGMNGHGCQEGTVCAPSLSTAEPSSGSEVCVVDEDFLELLQQDESSSKLSDGTVRTILAASVLIAIGSILALCFMWGKLQREEHVSTSKIDVAAKPDSATSSLEDTTKKSASSGDENEWEI